VEKKFLVQAETTQRLDLRPLAPVDDASFFASRRLRSDFCVSAEMPMPYGFSRRREFSSRAVDDLRI
jgi:hypothetical protein